MSAHWLISCLSSDEAWLAAQVSKFEGLAFSANTNRTYASHRRSYLAFCEKYGFVAVPATTDTIVSYAAALASRIKYGSIRCYMNTVRLIHLEFGLPNPLCDNFRYCQVMRGIRRSLGDTPKRKSPVTPHTLRQMRCNLDTRGALDACVWGAACTLFFGMLRKASLLPSSRSQTSGFICRRDVSIWPWGLHISCSSSKTIQFQQRKFSVFIPAKRMNQTCALHRQCYAPCALCQRLPMMPPSF